MSEQGQHKNDRNHQRIAKGVNRPTQSQQMTTGSYKKPETYAAQARQHKAVESPGQGSLHTWTEDTRDRARMTRGTRQHPGSGRSGSQSNAN